MKRKAMSLVLLMIKKRIAHQEGRTVLAIGIAV